MVMQNKLAFWLAALKIKTNGLYPLHSRKYLTMEHKPSTGTNASRYHLHIVKCARSKKETTNPSRFYGFYQVGRGVFITCFLFVFMLSVHKLYSSSNVKQAHSTSIFTKK
jgi:hypothetical protein